MTSSRQCPADILPPPTHLLAGGRWRRKGQDPLLSGCIALAGVPSPSVAYIGTASGDDAGFFQQLAMAFRDAGAGSVNLVRLCDPHADAKAACEQLAGANLVFVSGGDVEAGMRCLHRHALAPLLRRLHRDGKPFFGLSAGSIMLAQSWVRWEDPKEDSSAEAFPCIGVAPILCDTHAEEDDWEELKTLLRLLPAGAVGYGIPSGGGLRIAGPTVTALGLPLLRFRHDAAGIRPLPPLECQDSAITRPARP